jgi:two-component system, sensor histidine kinase and response regulator
LKKPRILVVEDHEAMLTAISSILKSDGYAVTIATDGVEALQIMKEITPDLILADIMMPRMNGFALYKEVRADPKWVSVPFIFLTAKSEKEDILRGKALGAEDYIVKPFSPQELSVAVRARLKRARAIESAAQAEFDELKQQIATVLGHELRTPLTYISGYTELALDDISDMPPNSVQDFLQGIKMGADRLVKLVEDLLLLVRLDTGQVEKDIQDHSSEHKNLGEVVRDTVQRYEKQAQRLEVPLDVNVKPNIPTVRIHELHLVNALGRLVENGLKFSRGKGSPVTVNVQPLGDGVEIAVSDKGIGIPPHKQPLLFERFCQIDREKMEQSGTGVGLAIAKELLEAQGGEITVDSTPGEGSTFAIWLPIASSGE